MLFSSQVVDFSLKSLKNNNPVTSKLSPIDSKLNFTYKIILKELICQKIAFFKPILSVKINYFLENRRMRLGPIIYGI
jgi:hypothetical protein